MILDPSRSGNAMMEQIMISGNVGKDVATNDDKDEGNDVGKEWQDFP